MTSILDTVIRASEAAQAQKSNRLMDAVLQQQLQQQQAMAPLRQQTAEMGLESKRIKQAQQRAGILNRSMKALRKLPQGSRAAAYQNLEPRLRSFGIDTSQFADSGLTDQELDAGIASTEGFISDPISSYQRLNLDLQRRRLDLDERRLEQGAGRVGLQREKLERSTDPELQETLEERKAIGKATGKAKVEKEVSIEKKVKDATESDEVIGMARALLPLATSSILGTFADQAGRLVGMSNEGAKAAAQLKVLSAKLVANVPRFEGPQSNIDVQFYKEAAGQLGDSTLPAETRIAALKTIEELNAKAKQQQAGKEAELGVQQETEAPQEQTIRGFTRQQYIDAGATAEELRELGF